MDAEAAKRLLGELTYDPESERLFELIRSAFVWEDELPPSESDAHSEAVDLLSPVFVYRASLSLGEPRAEYEAAWSTLRAAVPTWPGFREERISGSQRDLKAARLRQERFFDRLDDEVDGADDTN